MGAEQGILVLLLSQREKILSRSSPYLKNPLLLGHGKMEHSLSNLIHQTNNFVTNEEIIALYRQSIALVMPSYFGPTNLPPLEAFQLGVPVLYSDKAGLRDQVGDAGLLMDLRDPNSMAHHLKNLIEDEQLRHRLIKAGFERLKHFDAYDRIGVLRSVIEDFHSRRFCWE